jgi:hypothetical protein
LLHLQSYLTQIATSKKLTRLSLAGLDRLSDIFFKLLVDGRVEMSTLTQFNCSGEHKMNSLTSHCKSGDLTHPSETATHMHHLHFPLGTMYLFTHIHHVYQTSTDIGVSKVRAKEITSSLLTLPHYQPEEAKG